MRAASPSALGPAMWLGNLPVTWSVARFKDLFEFVGSPRAGEIPLLSLTRNGLVERDISSNEGQLAASYEDYPVVETGTFVLNPMDLVGGWVARSMSRGRVSGAYFSFRLRAGAVEAGHVPSFFEHVFQTYYRQRIFEPFGVGVGRRESGGGRWTLNRETLKQFPLPVPPPEEQRRIADRLDNLKSQIDEVDNQLLSLEQLAERRESSALLSALLKGDPAPPKVRSKIPWLRGASVPRHWLELPLGRVVRMQSGGAITSTDIEPLGDFPVFGGGGLRGYTNRYNVNGVFALIGRQGALCGNVRIVSGKFFATEHAIVCYPRRELDVKWLAAILEAMDLGQYSQSTAQPGLSVTELNKIRLPVPPVEEQTRIVESLEKLLAPLERLSEQSLRLRECLKEKLGSSIHHVVTAGLEERGG